MNKIWEYIEDRPRRGMQEYSNRRNGMSNYREGDSSEYEEGFKKALHTMKKVLESMMEE